MQEGRGSGKKKREKGGEKKSLIHQSAAIVPHVFISRHLIGV